jgi:hypothetical protein
MLFIIFKIQYFTEKYTHFVKMNLINIIFYESIALNRNFAP